MPRDTGDLTCHLRNKLETSPAEEKRHVKERGEVGEELEGKHLDSEAPLGGSKGPCFL